MKPISIAVIGGGIGGMMASMALAREGVKIEIFEQAAQLRRVGAAINLTPNAVKVLDRLGAGLPLRSRSFSPAYRVSRTWDSGEETSRIEMGASAEQKYGSPQLIVHRADLLSAMLAVLPPGALQTGRRLTDVGQDGDSVELTFHDGERRRFDAVVGADGIHSTVRHSLFGDDNPIYTGMVAYRAVFPAERLQDYETESFVKWWGPNPSSQLVTSALNGGREMFVFATRAEPEARESWSAECDVDSLRAAFSDYHPQAQRVLACCDPPFKTALYIRDPLPSWGVGRIALLGDACHPMVPFMAQGGAMALEDAAILSRCVAEAADLPSAFRLYEAIRRPRASRIQKVSSDNNWLRTPANVDWVYGYDAWTAPLTAPPSDVN